MTKRSPDFQTAAWKVRALNLHRLSDAYGCRPSDIQFGEARDAIFDFEVASAAGEIEGQIARVMETDKNATHATASKRVVAQYVRAAEREREKARDGAES